MTNPDPTPQEVTTARWTAVWLLGFCLLVLALLLCSGCATQPVDTPCGYVPVERDAGVVKYLKVYCVGTEV